jgi:hypothetical protein
MEFLQKLVTGSQTSLNSVHSTCRMEVEREMELVAQKAAREWSQAWVLAVE